MDTMIADNPLANTIGSERKCPYCGTVLQQRVLDLNGKEYFAGYVECSCDGAKEEREAQRQQAEETAQKEKRRMHLAKLEKAGIPKHFYEAKADVSSYIQAVSSGRSIVFSGDVGVGKTYLACATASAFVDNSSVIFTCMAQINSAKFNAVDGNDFLQALARCRLLVVDDLGKEKPSEWMLSLVYEVIERRYNAELPIIVTTNYTMEGLRRRLGSCGNDLTAKAIVSRLYEMCGGAPIYLDGGDRRLNTKS